MNLAGKYNRAADVALALNIMSLEVKSRIQNVRIADESLVFYARSSMMFVACCPVLVLYSKVGLNISPCLAPALL